MTATGSRRTPVAPLVALRFDGRILWAIDQRELPARERRLALRSADEVAAAIRRLSIRGAPLIGIAAAYGVALDLARDPSAESLERACATLGLARPTAVNLTHAINRVRAAALAAPEPDRAGRALAQARAIEADEETASGAIAAGGADLLSSAATVLTHCNTGALAAPGRGTALAVIAELAARGSLRSVIATESRPLLQGARLTTYELDRLGIAFELVVDAAAPSMIASGTVDAVVVGCDRIAANGDVANKIGTYPLALAAHAAGVPFVVAGPTSTVDPNCPTGAQIVIEQRDPDEVRSALGPLTVPGVPCRNPAFDVTPAGLIHALVTEHGVARPVGLETILALRSR